jgi:hypothetical protein
MTDDIERYRTNLHDELNGAALYAALAAAEFADRNKYATQHDAQAISFEERGHAAQRAVGMLTSLFNGRGPWYSAFRQLIFGCLAAGVTYGVGVVLGTSLS